MGYRPGDTYHIGFTTAVAGGAAGVPDSAPTVTMNHNGSDDGSFAITVAAALDVGRYTASGTVPAGYTGGDTFDAFVVATIGGLVYKSRVDHQVVDRLPAIKKNTAFNYGFYMPLTSDHQSPATGLTITARRVLDGGAYSAVGGTVTQISNGYYEFAAAAADTNCTTGIWEFSGASADTQRFPFATAP
jgi:hypothetical protein